VERFSLYGGLVHLDYDDPNHEYFVDGEIVPNVTSVTAIKAKPWLGRWMVSVVTKEILSRWDEAGTTNKSREDLIKQAKKKPEEIRDAAAGWGKEAHKWIENHIKAQLLLIDPPPMPEVAQVLSAVQAFLSWEAQHRVHYLASEMKVYSLTHRYTGTFDILAEIDGEVGLPDLKTSNNYSDSFALQTAAYLAAYNEEHNTKYRDRWVLMLHKETAEFNAIHLSPSRYQHDVDGFHHALGLWRWQHMEDEYGISGPPESA